MRDPIPSKSGARFDAIEENPKLVGLNQLPRRRRSPLIAVTPIMEEAEDHRPKFASSLNAFRFQARRSLLPGSQNWLSNTPMADATQPLKIKAQIDLVDHATAIATKKPTTICAISMIVFFLRSNPRPRTTPFIDPRHCMTVEKDAATMRSGRAGLR